MINFFRNLFGSSLKSKVMKVIETKINNAEKALKDELKVIKKEAWDAGYKTLEDARIELKRIESQKKTQLIETTDKHINNILSKIL